MNKDTIQNYINDANRSTVHEHESTRFGDPYRKAVTIEQWCAQWMRVRLNELLTLTTDQNIDRRLLAERLWEPRYKTSRWYQIFMRFIGNDIERAVLPASSLRDGYEGDDLVEDIIQEYLTLRALKEAYQAIRYEIFEVGRIDVQEFRYERSRLAIELGEPRWRTSRIGFHFRRRFTMIHSSAEIYSLACKDVFGQGTDMDLDEYKWEDENGIRTVSVGRTLHYARGKSRIIWVPLDKAKIPQAYSMKND